MDYFRKMKGSGRGGPRVSLRYIVWSWSGSFIGIGAVALISYRLLDGTDLVIVIGSFGASAVLIYGAIASPLAQPRNLVGGHIVSAIIGVAVRQLLPELPWLAAPLAVATAIAAMQFTGTLHPPGGATALIAVIGSAKIHALGFLYVLMPVAAGAAIMLVVALLMNNLASDRKYPESWL